jgi:hypothetical protein
MAAVDSLVAPLRALGGTASAASVSAVVVCVVSGGAAPMGVRAGETAGTEHAYSEGAR